MRYFDEAFQAFTESSVCQGMIWWIAFDYYGQNYYNNMGIFNHNRTIAYETQAHMRWAYGNFTKENL